MPLSSSSPDRRESLCLGEAAPGFCGFVTSVSPDIHDEVAYRLLESGFIEGMQVEILHEGPCGRDPIAVRLGDMTLALRRAEANRITVRESGRP